MNEPQPSITINAIKTDIGYFVQSGIRGYFYHGELSGLESYYFDGRLGEKTYNSFWLKILDIPKRITQKIGQPHTNKRWELIDKELASTKYPLVVLEKDCAEIDEKFYPLYEHKSDPQPDLEIEIPFEFKIILEIDNIKEYGGFSYPVQRTEWAHEGFRGLTDKEANHDTIDTIIFPNIILPARTSFLTSQQVFKVVRKHVQDNIDPKYAHITSDYDFCFCVRKKIPLCKPIPYKKDISRIGARKPKYITDYRNNREIDIFEMTYSPKNYKGYTPIREIRGKNIEDLKEKIDQFLLDLMEKINEPLKDCPHCNGMGVILEEKK